MTLAGTRPPLIGEVSEYELHHRARLAIKPGICYPFITDSTVLDQTSIFVLVLVLGVNGSLEFFTLAKYRALLTADQRTYVISLASIVYTVLNTIIVVTLSIMHINIVLLRIIALLSIFVRTLILYENNITYHGCWYR